MNGSLTLALKLDFPQSGGERPVFELHSSGSPPTSGRAQAARPGTAPVPVPRPLIEVTGAGPRLGFMPMAQVHRGSPLPVGRRRASLPVISLGTGIVRRYEAEKIYGVRRANGARKLNRLSHRHYEIIIRHLSGQSAEQIHNEMALSINTISRVLNDPLAQEVIKRSYKDRQQELDALAGAAIGAVRDALQKGSTSEKLAAVDKFTKLKQSIAPETNPATTAEDLARSIVQNAQNVQVNIGSNF